MQDHKFLSVAMAIGRTLQKKAIVQIFAGVPLMKKRSPYRCYYPMRHKTYRCNNSVDDKKSGIFFVCKMLPAPLPSEGKVLD